MKWESVTLDKLGIVSRGRSKHRPRDDSSLYGGRYPFIQTADVKAAPFYITDYNETYNEKGLAQSKLWRRGTLCITIAANIADTAILDIDACFPDSVMGFIPYEGISDVRFIKYAFDMLQRDMRQISQGTAQDNLSWQKLSTIQFPDPPIEVQRRIADYLVAYENLIENNQKQIKLLEEAAQRLYKEWFVDLRFPGHENTPIVDGVPEGWKRMHLENLIAFEIGGGWGEEYPIQQSENGAYVIRGTDLLGLTHGNVTSIPFRYHSNTNLESRILKDGDIVFEVSGGSRTEGVARTALITSKLLKAWNKAVMCASFCKLVRPVSKELSSYLFYHFQYLRESGRTEEYDKRSASSIVNYRWKDFLSHEIILKPRDAVLQQYNNFAEDYYKQIITKSIQIETAKMTRDRLLPKLMSGEIEV